MEFFYNAIALLTAGVTLVTGLISFFTGIHKDAEKTELIFGIMCLSMCAFFLLPPVGFILEDKAPYLAEIKIKRLFNFGFAALLPWFILLYSGLKKKIMPIVINVLIVVGYLTMFFTKTDTQKPVWVLYDIAFLGLTVIYGFYGAFMQIKNEEKNKGRWFMFAISFIAVLYLLTVVNQLGNNYFGRMFGTKLFFPVNLFPLPFTLIMSMRLRANIFEKYRLEKMLRTRDLRWNSLLQSMQLLIVELDNEGRIKYLNPYAVKMLGCKSQAEFIGKNWFDSFIKKETEYYKTRFNQTISEGKLQTQIIGHIVTKSNDKLIINWTNVFVHNNDLKIEGIISIGLNITDQEKAFEEVRALKNELTKEALLLDGDNYKFENEPGIIGKSEAIVFAIQKARTVAETNATALLEGETGVGKELFANLIHDCSNRSNRPFIKANCSAFPADLIESELFGHEKGAFTGASQARKGRFELANGGTIFLDEIADLPLALQPKLLRVLQNGEFEKLGGQGTIKTDVRIISATNKNLLNEVKAGRFREDLFYRLNVFPITIPALRDRKEDIEVLVKHFLNVFSSKQEKRIENVSKADMMRLNQYSWPGNIRELINVIERSVISTKGDTLKLEWPPVPDDNIVLSVSIKEVERTHIIKVLKECNWKINGDSGAAAMLGLNPNTLRSRLKKLSISREDFIEEG